MSWYTQLEISIFELVQIFTTLYYCSVVES